MTATREPNDTPLDLAERGLATDGAPRSLDRRLFFQLLAFTRVRDPRPLADALAASGIGGVLYENVHDPRGVALLAFAEDPAHLAGPVRTFVNGGPFAALDLVPELGMLGRTYSIGYERDLETTLVSRPRDRALDPAFTWAIWYPLRRSGSFERLDAAGQRAALMEHGSLGRRFGESGHAVDIRLASHGLDARDNDFTIALLGPRLHALSALVQAMRRTVQTSTHVERMGPFFVGRVIHRERGR